MSARESASQSVVTTSSGKLAGIDGAIRQFRGVPFAAPPVGDLRWKRPVAHEGWTGVRDATQFGFDCPQAPQAEGTTWAPGQSEDCLTVNIWTPARGPGEKLPVMVWIFGGSFVAGSASDPRSDGRALAEQGVVVVTMNYRLGIFGFLAHPELAGEMPNGVSGNYGMADQIEALKWVKENIEAFGGDPERVTLFGMSAGAASVAQIITSDAARGLFQRTIMESPGAFRPLCPLADAQSLGATLGDVADLRALSTEDVFALTPQLVPKVRGLTTPRALRPIRDGDLIKEDDRDAYRGGRFAVMPAIVGQNGDEGTKFVTAWPIKTVDQYRALLAENFGDHAEEAFTHYPAASEEDVIPAMGMLFGDTQFGYGTWGIANEMAKREHNTFRYVFTRPTPGNAAANHGDEVPYVWGTVGKPPYEEADRELSQVMVKAWAHFATMADPNTAGVPPWAAYDPDQDNALRLDEVIEPISHWRADQMAFLDRFFESK